MFCACLLGLLVLIAIFAPLIAPYDPNYQDYSAVLGGPCKAHLFGTDEYGRDILSRIIYGSRVSISIGIVAQIIASIVGVALGSLAGYYGGWVDSLISRVMEIFQAFRGFDQNAHLGGFSRSDHDGHWRGQAQCARAGDHQHGDGVRQGKFKALPHQ